MPGLSIKYPHSILIASLLVLAVFLTAWRHLAAGVALGLIFLLFGLAATGYAMVKTYRSAYLRGEISLPLSIRNACLEIAGILLAMLLAALPGRSLAQAAAGFMENERMEMIAGIGIGLLVGILAGLLVQRGTRRLLKTLSGD